MQGEIQQEQWQAYLDGFSKRNSGRMADLQILSDELGTQEQAEMLPFEGITLDTKGFLASSVEIMLGGTGSADKRNLTHTVTRVRRIVPKTGAERTRRSTRNRSQRRRKNHPNLQDAPGTSRKGTVSNHSQWNV